MTDHQWRDLLAVLRGERVDPLPIGFIIDCRVIKTPTECSDWSYIVL
jgi:hypothetical protein